ncbi:PilZ domain-containing protein [Candidatus Omnitrophota bacterium]
MMTVRIRSAGGVSIVDIEGAIDIDSSRIIEAIGWLINNKRRNILLNMKAVSKVDYSGLSILAIAYKNVANHKGKIKFVNIPLPIKDLINLVRLDMVFETFEDEESAIKSFSRTSKIDSMKMRRRFKRIFAHARISYKLSGKHKGKQSFTGDALNLSASGAFLYAADTFPLNTLLELEIQLPGEPGGIKVGSKVVWLADKEIQPHSYPGMGVVFLKIGRELEDKILRFIDKQITSRAGP